MWLYVLARFVCMAVFLCFFKLEYHGTENIPAKGPYIVASNHRCAIDPILLAHKIPQRICYMGKMELFKNPISRWAFTTIGSFPVDRGAGDTGAIDDARAVIERGELLGIFPEGTRAKTCETLRPKSGCALVAKLTGADILPCSVYFEGELGFRRKIVIRYGELIPFAELGMDRENDFRDLRTGTKTMFARVLALLEESKMRINVAKTAGFCFGVDRAVRMVYDALERGERLCTLGPIIHNKQMVAELEEQGVYAVDTPAEAIAPDGTKRRVVIRSHGVARSVYDELEALGLSYEDATCPFVAKIHRIVAGDYGPDGLVLIAGDAAHPEVIAIRGHCKSPCHIFANAAELANLLAAYPNITKKRVVLVAQTTLNVKEWENSVKTLKKVCTNAEIFDTICNATMLRQEEAESLARQSDKMIVVGGHHSSNTAKLHAICSAVCPTVWVETADELDTDAFAGVGTLSITAGASTPACIIKEVQKTMSEILTDELSFEEMLDLSFKSTHTGDKVTGVVTSVAPNEVAVDIGTKHAGYVPLAELTDDPSAKADDLVKVGDELELIVLRVNDVEGTVMLSKKRLDAIAGFEKVMEASESGEVLEGTVTEVVRGGVLVLTNGVKVFIPASQATRSRNDNLEDLLKQPVRFKILEYNKQRRRAVGSIKAVLRDEKKVLEDKFWAEVEIGKTYEGTVKSLTDYGAFIDLGGVDGMVHISELSWSKIKHPSQVVKVGDVVEVYVKDIDTEKKKISLGYKKNEDNPWEILKRDYAVGSVCEVKIVSLTLFGAFAQIIPGVDGLIHISQISNERINKPADVLKVGDVVNAKITEIDFDKKRISLSIKALLAETDEAADEE